MVENDNKYKFENKKRSIENLHPLQVALYLSMIGSASIFFFLMVAFYATAHPDLSLYLSRYFILSTIVILTASILVHRLVLLFEKEKLVKIRNMILGVIFLGSLFLVVQVVGWRDMQSKNELLNFSGPSSLIYIISGLHLLHTIIMIFLSLSYLKTYSKMVVDPIEALLRCSNPHERVKIKLFTQAWHYLNITWVILLIGIFII